MNYQKKGKPTAIMQYCRHCNKLRLATKTYYVDTDNPKKGMTEIVCECGKLLKRQEF